MQMSMLTTVDNPFSPFDEYPEWLAFDVRRGYNSISLLARVTIMSSDLSEADQSDAIELAINEIVEQNVSGMHRKVTKEFPDSEIFDLEEVTGD